MFDYNNFITYSLRPERIAKVAAALEPREWIDTRPNIFVKWFTALQPSKRTQSSRERRSVNKPALAKK